jgi:hypothetical protein
MELFLARSRAMTKELQQIATHEQQCSTCPTCASRYSLQEHAHRSTLQQLLHMCHDIAAQAFRKFLILRAIASMITIFLRGKQHTTAHSTESTPAAVAIPPYCLAVQSH